MDTESGWFPLYVRLPGFAGAALTIEAIIQPARPPQLLVDIGILTPDRLVRYLARQTAPGFQERLRSFLLEAGSAQNPELSVRTLQDDGLGMALSVERSNDRVVEIQVLVIEDLNADVQEHDGANFETSRAALVAAAQSIPSGESDARIPEGWT